MDKNEELKRLAMPLIDILYRDYHPHAQIIIRMDSVEVVEGVLATPIEVRD